MKFPLAVLRPVAALRGSHRRRRAAPSVGTAPGTLQVQPGDLPPRLFLISFDVDEVHEREYLTYAELLKAYSSRPDLKHWLDVRGYGDPALLAQIRDDFHLSPLQLEDVLHDHQRPKMEVDTEGRFFLVSRMLELTPNLGIHNDQLSIFTGPNYVISFQVDYNDCLDSLRSRLRSERAQIRRRPILYLAYALLDTVIDFYFPLLNKLTEHIEELEEAVFASPSRLLLARILMARKELIKVRRLVVSERDKLNELLRLEADALPDELRPFIRDLYDHTTQAIELTENARETISNVAELYQSEVNNRMNQVMKLLTIISSIFIPLSFIVGLYGMNFQPTDKAGHELPLNMPELYQPHGYIALLAVMSLVVAGQLTFFWWRGWFR